MPSSMYFIKTPVSGGVLIVSGGVWIVPGCGLRVSEDVLIPNLLATKLY